MDIKLALKKLKETILAHRSKLIFIGITFFIGAVLFGTVFLYVDSKEIAKTILSFHFWKFIVYLGVASSLFFLSTWRWLIIIKSYGFKVKFWRLFRYMLAGFGFSYLTPIAELGGGPFRAHLLTREGVPFKNALVTVIVDDFVSFFIEALITPLIIIYLIISLGVINSKISLLIAITSALFVLILILIYLRLRKGKLIISDFLILLGARKFRLLARARKAIMHLEEPFVEFFNKKRRPLKKVAMIFLAIYLLGTVEAAFLLFLMGSFPGWLNAFFARTIIYASNIFPVPAGLGVSEWGGAAFFSLLPGGKSVGLVFSILFKARSLFFSFLGLGIFLYYWFKKLPWHQKIKNYLWQKLLKNND